MSAPLIVVTGTGTGIGKTHVTGALLVAWTNALRAAGSTAPRVAGLKPVETGVSPSSTEGDGQTLEQLSTFHVKRFPPPYLLTRAVSPHLAAREEGVTIDRAVIRRYVDEVRQTADGVVVELAGGLFSPLAPTLTNADVARDLGPDAILLVAPDRLGVLHDVAATARAAAAVGVTLTGVVLVAPAVADTSTGSNAAELAVVTDLPVLAVVPRGSIEGLAAEADLVALVTSWTRSLRPL